MAKKFGGKYRIDSVRAKWWDYAKDGAYFITICTKNRKHAFGEIVGGKMVLSAVGHIANSCWYEIPNHFPFVELDAYVIMPNHVHGIVIINKSDDGHNVVVETQDFASLPPKNQFGPQSKNLASIVRGFKIGVTKNARKLDPCFAWQSRFHDHIIRNEKSLNRIRNYIQKNPEMWHRDRNMVNGIWM